MLNRQSIQTVDLSKYFANFIKPCYSDYCFSNIPQTVENLFTGSFSSGLPNSTIQKYQKKNKKVLLILLDAFGWTLFEKNKNKFPLLKSFVKDGVVSKLTAQFPSTTAAEITTIHTGQPVGKHGVYEWYYYEPLVDNIIAPLLFSFVKGNRFKERETLRSASLDPKQFFPNITFYQNLAKKGINSYIFQHREYTPSAYSDIVFNGSKVNGYIALSEGLTNIAKQINEETQPAYFFIYYDKVDSLSHRYGPNSKQVASEIELFFTALEKILIKNIEKKKELLIILTADHGQISVKPKDTYYINLKIPELLPLLKTNNNNEVIKFAGSCRDLFLYIKPEKILKAKELLQKKLINKALIIETKELIKQGFFGKEISITFKERLADIAILPYNNNTVFWYEKNNFEMTYLGHHGGLSRHEMEIPFLIKSF